MAKRETISADYVRQLLEYNEATGELIWKYRLPEMFARQYRTAEVESIIWNKKFAGKVAGWKRSNGYKFVTIVLPFEQRGPKPCRGDYIVCRQHRVIWLIKNGRWPTNQLDHENGHTGENRLGNLREAEHFENHQNVKIRKDSTSGMTGVSWSKTMKKWWVYINLKGVRYHIGYFTDLDEAKAARAEAKAKYHKFQPVQRI